MSLTLVFTVLLQSKSVMN
ncbi:Protein of unknown function [Bacillus cereus]|uniref:Uncharacterized protein n=1 Tax=Bacillus wiedmannii TaxID=1890302 RepID=A0AB37YWL2_9BACI|nr:Protein of unknown function [Bacillus wiedmannii]SCC59957.1 Protein of unknown function [Bacillus cereus]SCN38405.1 Protein of unknown function [Bacillus wiedmannii]